MIAHVGGVPLEEMLPLAPGAGALLVLARAWVATRLPCPTGAPGRLGRRVTALSQAKPLIRRASRR